MVSGQPAVVGKGQVREGHGAVRCYRPETHMHGPLAHQAEHLPFKQVVPGSSPGRLIPTQRSSDRHISPCKRPHRLAWSRTSPFHGGNGGSNPPGDACPVTSLPAPADWASSVGVHIASMMIVDESSSTPKLPPSPHPSVYGLCKCSAERCELCIVIPKS